MLALLVAGAVSLQSQQPLDSPYATDALRALVERASVQNRRVPDSLLAYTARAESELAIAARQADGVEQIFAVEQTDNVVRWRRTGDYEQRVVGYRSQSVGLTLSAVGMFRQAWTVPILYGNRIALLLGRPDSAARGDTPRRRRRARRGPDVTAIHPFASDRDGVYRFSGGDTITTLHPGGRDIPIARIHVEPRTERVTRPTTLFRGDIEVDADRAHIVRMRGYFITAGRRQRVAARLIASQVEAVAYVELENGEFDQRYWLPTYQRFEAQASVAVLGDQRAVFRVVTRFRDMTINPPDSVVVAQLDSLGVDTLRLVPHRLTFAPADSIDDYDAWARDVGDLSATVHADDFADVAPSAWRAEGRPIVRV